MKNRILRSVVWGLIGCSPYLIPAIFAQTQAPQLDWTSLLKDAGFCGLLWYVTGVILPKVLNDHRAERVNSDVRHKEERAELYKLIAEFQKNS